MLKEYFEDLKKLGPDQYINNYIDLFNKAKILENKLDDSSGLNIDYMFDLTKINTKIKDEARVIRFYILHYCNNNIKVPSIIHDQYIYISKYRDQYVKYVKEYIPKIYSHLVYNKEIDIKENEQPLLDIVDIFGIETEQQQTEQQHLVDKTNKQDINNSIKTNKIKHKKTKKYTSIPLFTL